MAGSIGGGIAEGIQSGFQMGLNLDNQREQRRARQFSESRQTQQDTIAAQDRARRVEREDLTAANAEQERAFKATDLEMADIAHGLAGEAQAAGGIEKIAPEIGRKYQERSKGVLSTRAGLLRSMQAPYVEKKQQKVKDIASRLAAKQINENDLSDDDLLDMLEVARKGPATDFLRPEGGGNSVVGQGIADTMAALPTMNGPLLVDGVGALLKHDIEVGIGRHAPDGSVITGKRLIGLLPAPNFTAWPGQQTAQENPVQGLAAALNAATAPEGAAPQTPAQPVPPMGSDPTRFIPVLRIDAEHADGTPVSYTSGISSDRGSDPNETMAPGISTKDAMDHMGRLGTTEAWANRPEIRARIKRALEARGDQPSSYLSAYRAMHGDPKALLAPGEEEPHMKEFRTVQKIAKELGIKPQDVYEMRKGKKSNLEMAAEMRVLGIPEDKIQKYIADIMLGAKGKTTGEIVAPAKAGTEPLSQVAIDQAAASVLKGDRNALVGLGRDPNKITQVLNRMAELSPNTDLAGNRAAFSADKKSLDKIVPQYDAIVAFENSAIAQGKVLVQLAKKVDATGVPVFERWVRAGRKSIKGDPDVAEYDAQHQLFTTEAAKIITNPNLAGPLTDSARHEIHDVLPKASSFEQVERVVGRLEADFGLRKKSLEDQTEIITKRMANRGVGASGTATGLGAKIAPTAQAASDVAAGKQMVLAEHGGDLNRARAELAAMQDGIKRAPKGEARSALESQAARLKAGIDALSQKGLNLSEAPNTSKLSPAEQAELAQLRARFGK